MPLYNKIQLKYLLDNLNAKPLPKKSDPKEDEDFIKNFIAVMEKIIGHTELDNSFRKSYIETFILFLESDDRLLKHYNPQKQDIQKLNLHTIFESGEKEYVSTGIDLVVFLLNNKCDLEYQDFVYEKFKNDGDEDRENLKLILKTIRNQNMKITSKLDETIGRMNHLENYFKTVISEQNNLIKNIYDDNNEVKKHLDGKENDIKIIHTRISDQFGELSKIKEKIFKVEETYSKMQKLEDFKLNYEIKFNDFSTQIKTQLENTTKGAELRITGRIQSNEEAMERLLTRISSCETKLEIESSRINKSENSNENNYEIMSTTSTKIKNQQDIIDEMRKMLFARLAKVESSIRNNTQTLNSNMKTTPMSMKPNHSDSFKETYKNNSHTPNVKSLTKLQLEDNLDHTPYLEHLEQQQFTTVTKNDYYDHSVNRNNRNLTPTPQRTQVHNTSGHYRKDSGNNSNSNLQHTLDEDRTELDTLKIQIESLNKKQFEILSHLNNDRSDMNVAKLETEMMDIRTEMIKNRKSFEEVRELSDVTKMNKKLEEFKNELEMHFKSMKNDSINADFSTQISNIQRDIEELKSSMTDPKFQKDSKKIKIKQIENLEQVTVEVQRLSDGLNNLFSFTQAYIDSQAYEKERLIHTDANVKDKMDCLEFVAKNLEFISDEAINSVVASFEEISVNSVYGNTQKQNVAEYKYAGSITNNISDMVVVYNVFTEKDERDVNVVRNVRGLLNILKAALFNKANVRMLATYNNDQKNIDRIIIQKMRECEDEKVYDYGLECLCKMLEYESFVKIFYENESYREIIQMTQLNDTDVIILKCGKLFRIMLRSDVALERVAKSGEDLPTTVVYILEKYWMNLDIVEEWLSVYRNFTRKMEMLKYIDSVLKINRVVEIAYDNNMKKVKHIALGVIRNVCKNQEFSKYIRQINATDLLLTSNM